MKKQITTNPHKDRQFIVQKGRMKQGHLLTQTCTIYNHGGSSHQPVETPNLCWLLVQEHCPGSDYTCNRKMMYISHLQCARISTLQGTLYRHITYMVLVSLFCLDHLAFDRFVGQLVLIGEVAFNFYIPEQCFVPILDRINLGTKNSLKKSPPSQRIKTHDHQSSRPACQPWYYCGSPTDSSCSQQFWESTCCLPVINRQNSQVRFVK